MFKSPGRSTGIKKSPISFIKAVTSPRTQPRLLNHQSDKVTTSMINETSILRPNTTENPLTLTLQLQIQKPQQRSLKLSFSYNSETTIKQLLDFIKKQTGEEHIVLKSQNFSIDYYLTLPHRLVTQLDRNKMQLLVEKIKIDKKASPLNNFQIIRCIGTGGFSKVYLGRAYGKLMALKIISKNFILQNQKQNIVNSEREILEQCIGHPFITQLYLCFETPNFLIFCMEYCNGGELFNLLRKVRRMKENEAKFYFLQTLAAIAHLHAHNILYRDLKPQNIIIDADGHIRLADYGLSKVMREDRTHSFCGSAEYMAPQMLLKKGHSFEIDYYCLGALLYELVFGLPPYYSRDQDELFNNILTQDLQFPTNISVSKELRSFLERLLQKDLKLRFKKISEILTDPWLSDCSMQQVLQKKMRPPFPTNMFESNIDDSDFAEQEIIATIRLKQQKKQDNFNASQIAFPDFFFMGKEIQEIENQITNENKKWNFIKKPAQPVQEHQFTKQLLLRNGSIRSVGSNRRIMELIQHSPRHTHNHINYNQQIQSLIQGNYQFRGFHNSRASEIMGTSKVEEKAVASSFKLTQARSAPILQKYQHLHPKGNERMGSPINVHNYIHIQTSKSPQINFNTNTFAPLRSHHQQPQKKIFSMSPNLQKPISNSSYRNSNANLRGSGMGSMDRMKLSSYDRQMGSNGGSYLKNTVYYQTATQINRPTLSNLKQRLNPSLKIKKSVRSSDKPNFNFISTSPSHRY